MPASLTPIELRLDFPVRFTRGAFDPENDCLVDVLSRKETTRRHRALVIVDAGVVQASPRLPDDIRRYFERHGHAMALAGEPLVVPGGETVKNDPAHVATVLGRANDLGLDRQSFVIIVGGGAVLDMAGYAAALAHRGIRVVRLPTTVLSQADSGVGVKNGVNAFGKKNFLGTFVPPFAVILDSRFLETLSPRDRIAGMAEAVKVALVRDGAFFDWIVESAPRLRAGSAREAEELVQRSAGLHLLHISTSGDPFELGSARPLDFGHWSAHKLECLTEHRLRHGEAVGIGLALDALYSSAVGLTDASVAERVTASLEALGFRLWDEALDMRARDGSRLVLSGLEEFREHLGGELTVTMLRRAGEGVEIHEMDEKKLSSCLDRLRERGNTSRMNGA